MNNKQIYDKLVKILKKEDEEPMKTLEELKKELEIEIITDGKVNNNIKQAFKRLQNQNEGRTAFQQVLRNENDLYSITNGFYMITFTKEQLPKELQPYINPNEKDISTFQFEKMKNQDKDIKRIDIDYNRLLKVYKYNKLNKLDNMYSLTGGLTFNIQYFLDILTFLKSKDLKDVELWISGNNEHPINIYSQNGNAILLPIRMEKERLENQLRLQKQILNKED